MILLLCFLFTCVVLTSFFFFFNDTATTEIYTLSLHDALPIYQEIVFADEHVNFGTLLWLNLLELPKFHFECSREATSEDRKSTRLNSSHSQISYAVFCLKKKKKKRLRMSSTRRPPCT